MDGKEGEKKSLLRRIRGDYAFRTLVFSAVSFFITVIYTGYNVFLAVAYKSVWNAGIAVYFALLLMIRAYVIFAEMRYRKAGLSEEKKDGRRIKLFFVQSIALFFIDLALIAPISLMVMQKKPTNYTMIPAIAMAAYTTYKIVASAMNFAKTRKMQNLSVKILRNINFMDACVSVLTLQYTLIMAVAGGINDDMRILCAVTTFVIWAFLIVISVLTLINAVKIVKIKNARGS